MQNDSAIPFIFILIVYITMKSINQYWFIVVKQKQC